ncbi:DUF72 domain-containing protein [Candidatus Binatia bacterium]|nr:DUF72 domain-containing protein [Candidatus Binatia bacterium]
MAARDGDLAEWQLDLFGGTPQRLDTGVKQGSTRGAAADRPVEPVAPSSEHAALAQRLPSELRLGTSSWSFPGWRGIVYDDGATQARLARSGLAAYARHRLLRTVGLDRTYYAALNVEDYATYAAQVPRGFRFLVKAPEALTIARYPTHERYGALRGTDNATFLDAAWAEDALVGPACEGLGHALGVILFQMPPQPAWALGGRERFAERLARFLGALPVGPVYAVELRTEKLLGGAYAQALESAGAVHCFNVHPTMPDVALQAATIDPTRGPALVVRWMLGGAQRYEAARERYRPFDALVDEDPAARASIAELCADAVRRGRPAYCVINNKAEGSAPLSAFKLAAEIAAHLT